MVDVKRIRDKRLYPKLLVANVTNNIKNAYTGLNELLKEIWGLFS